VDIRKVNLTWLREQLSLVSQEPHLFTGSIRDNITYGKEGATEEEVNNTPHILDVRTIILMD
jgi:ABC-type multidrug transport system fused ATPase/permease subunit